MKIKLIMPSAGDMELTEQDGGVITLSPIFYGRSSMGPHVQVLDDKGVVMERCKLTVSNVGTLRLEKQKGADDQ